ncbi:hypothetical protein [Haladaptatus litoreus]|uniref:hypothetical protein n=1 Tax=Haladaptatus litoreus TaxID=553468 RepID=UPI00158BE183|nr:hypothetical protein [Haladaptatus litoreus]
MTRPTRRDFVSAIGLFGLTGTTAAAGAQQGDDGRNLIVLGGETEGWLGRSPPRYSR